MKAKSRFQVQIGMWLFAAFLTIVTVSIFFNVVSVWWHNVIVPQLPF